MPAMDNEIPSVRRHRMLEAGHQTHLPRVAASTFLATGQVVVQGVVRGLGHGLDEEARRVAQQIRFRPATRDGRPVDMTTTITITFQLA